MRFVTALLRRRRIPVARALMTAAFAVILAAAACGDGENADAPPTVDPQAAIDATLASFFAAPASTMTAPADADNADAASRTPLAHPANALPTAGLPLAPVPTATPAGDGAYAIVPLTPPAGFVPAGVTAPTPTPDLSSVAFGDLINGRYLEQEQPRAANTIKSLPWIADGLTESEAAGAGELVNLAAFHPDIFFVIAGYAWVAEDVAGRHRTRLVENLRAIAQQDAASALLVSGMPFLRTLEPPDFAAVESLSQLAFFDPAALRRILSHPTLRNGIDDNWAKIVTLLHGVNRTNPTLLDTLLDPEMVTLEESVVQLPQSGETRLVIVRTGPGARRSMELLEHSVRIAELFMAAPLPTNYVAVLYETAVAGAFDGTNFGTHIAILPRYDVDDGSRDAELAGHIIAHEVAHYYWNGNANWVDEGASDFMASVSEFARIGKTVSISNPPCSMARFIQNLETLNLTPESRGFECNYSLGDRLFVDLYLNMDFSTFQRGFINLYQASLAADDADDRDGTSVGIDQVRQAFPDDNSQAVIGRWYNGAAPYDNRADTGPVDPDLPDINGRIDAAYISAAENGPALSRFSASETGSVVWLNLEFSYQFDAGSRETALEVTEYYQDGFIYRRHNADLRVESHYNGGTQYYSVGPIPPERWTPGRYWVYVYNKGRKVAEVAFEVTP